MFAVSLANTWNYWILVQIHFHSLLILIKQLNKCTNMFEKIKFTHSVCTVIITPSEDVEPVAHQASGQKSQLVR